MISGLLARFWSRSLAVGLSEGFAVGDLIFTDFKNKTGLYTKGGGIDDLELMAVELLNQIDTSDGVFPDTAPSEYVALDEDAG